MKDLKQQHKIEYGMDTRRYDRLENMPGLK
jgi:hypothetical protein